MRKPVRFPGCSFLALPGLLLRFFHLGNDLLDGNPLIQFRIPLEVFRGEGSSCKSVRHLAPPPDSTACKTPATRTTCTSMSESSAATSGRIPSAPCPLQPKPSEDVRESARTNRARSRD